MANLNDIYRCSVCGNIVELVHVGGGTLVCCGQEMKKLEAGLVDASLEKHVPVVDHKDNGYLVKVGSVEHPMEEKHYIQFIELIADGVVMRHQLKPGQKPEAFFCVQATHVAAREYCNLHGLWSTEQ